jgi:NTE family protein
MRHLNLPALGILCSLLVGCTAHYPVNQPYSPGVAVGAGVLQPKASATRSDSLLVGVAFSGGGTRAAAFAYGVLEVMAEAYIRWEGRELRLLDEIDTISSVSGGSFTAAYYGLFGDRIFEDYADKFLYRDVEGHLTWSLLSPVSWFKLGSAKFDRSDLAAEYYDEILFEGKTFGDLDSRNKPRLNINATEIALGLQFTFDPAQFALICSDYNKFPVSRAVTASSAVPILFSTVVLRNYAGTCPFEFPPWAKAAQASADTTSRAAHLARQMAKYADREAKPYIHLYDGGLSDNLGVRPLINRLSMAGSSWQFAKVMGAADTHRMLVIVVNAQSELSDEFQKSDNDLSLADAISASSSIPLNEYSFESLTLLRLAFEGLAAQLTKGRCKEWAETRRSTEGCDDFKIHLVEVDFDKLPDQKRRQAMKRLPTTFRLSVQEVDALRASAREIMTGSKDFQEFMRDMEGRWSAPASIKSK